MYDIDDFQVETNYANGGAKVCNILMVGVGGAGCNAVVRLMNSDITSADFVAVNTDAQALLAIKDKALQNRPSIRVRLLQIGKKVTGGQGAGADPRMGESAAIESQTEISKMLEGVQLCFIAAGMGGGTGTGAAPIIAKIAHEMDILTVAVVTKPFEFEGSPRMLNADKGIAELNKYIDSIIVIPNDKLDRTSINKAFAQADDVLRHAIKGIGDLIAKPCLINLDYADVCRIMRKKGFAHIGIGSGEGPDRALMAVKAAVKNTITDTTIYHATSMIISYQSGSDFVTGEIDGATNLVREVLKDDAEIIFGLDAVPELGDKMNVIVIATGFKAIGKSTSDTSSTVSTAKAESEQAAEAKPINQQEIVDGVMQLDGDPVPNYMYEFRTKK